MRPRRRSQSYLSSDYQNLIYTNPIAFLAKKRYILFLLRLINNEMAKNKTVLNRIKKIKHSFGATDHRPAIFSFFAGAGFLDLGFEKSGFDVVLVNEIHHAFLVAYRYARQKMGIKEPELGYHEDDIKKLLSKKDGVFLHEQVLTARKNHGLVGFIGGPPCPDFSIAGKNKGREGKNGILSKVYVDLIIAQQPDFFLFENVKGLWRTKLHRKFYEELKKKLARAGYVFTERLINSIEYGAPQDRDRIILLGFNKKYFGKNLAENITDFPWLKFIKFDKDDVFGRLWTETEEFKENLPKIVPTGIVDELTVEHWFKKNDVEKHPNAQHHFKPRAALIKFQTIPEGDVSKKSFKRLHRWRYSPTAAYGNNEVHIHPYKARRLSVAEALAIQSLPKEFILSPDITLSDQFKAVGNGVPFLAAKSVAESIKEFIKNNL